MTKDEAWADVHANKGEGDDEAVTDAWMAACAEVADNAKLDGDDQFTNEHWALVAKAAKDDLIR